MSDFGPDVGQCALCGRDPAAGRAAIHTGDETYWYCHDQDVLGTTSCYEQAQARLAAAADIWGMSPRKHGKQAAMRRALGLRPDSGDNP